MGFKDYCNEKKDIKDEDKKKIEDIYNVYKDKSEDELINELLKSVESQKKQGTFNYENLCSQVNKVQAFLTDEQRNKLQFILEKIK